MENATVKLDPIVIHIEAPRTALIFQTVNPEFFGPLDYDKDLHDKYLVIGWPNNGEFTVMDKDALREHFDLVGWKRQPHLWFFNPRTPRLK